MIRPSEEIVLYPTAASARADGAWDVEVRGVVFDRKVDSRKRRALLAVLARAMRLGEHDLTKGVFRERAGAFLVDHKRRRRFRVRVGGQLLDVGPSPANGQIHVRADLRIDPSFITCDRYGCRTVACEVEMPGGDPRSFAGRVHLVAETGLTVVCDIDDTLKISDVTDKRTLMRNTFLRRFRPVPAVSGLLRQIRKVHQGAAFHYVSASPWQLYEALEEFTRREGLPEGVFHLKTFRAKDRSAGNLLAKPDPFKLATIGGLLATWARRSAVLIGDSGERDPEIYGELARRYPEQVCGIAIRAVDRTDGRSERYAQAFEGVRRSVIRTIGDGDAWAEESLRGISAIGRRPA